MNEDQNIPKLPAEIIVLISKYLNIRDKFKLRLINKEFKATFDYLINLDQLIMGDSETKIHENWFYTNRGKNEIDLIEFNFNNIMIVSNILDDLFKKHVFLNLKKLFFYFCMPIDFNETISQLKYLEELNIKCRIISNSILSLSKLKILSIKQIGLIHTIELETPLLSILRCDKLEYYQFNYPEKIIYFDTKLMIYSKQIVNLNNQIQQFENLEYFILYDESIEELESISLTKLKHLKELHLNRDFIGTQVLIKIKEIYELKLRLKLNNLRIFISGIDYENLKELNEHQFINQLDLIFSNYSKTIDIIPFIHKIDFNKLFKFLNSNPNVSLEDVIYKFPNIQHIDANHVNNDNVDCFFEFLSKYDCLETLHLELLINNQIIYLNKLPDLCKRIKFLHLNNLNVNESTNLDFLFKFKKLSFLELGELDDMNILENLSINLDVFISCQFIYKEHSFHIQYRDKYWYKYENFNSSSELIKYFDYVIGRGYIDSSD